MFKHSRHKYVNFVRVYKKLNKVYDEFSSVKKRRKIIIKGRLFKFSLVAFLLLFAIVLGLILSQGVHIKVLYTSLNKGRGHIDSALAAMELRGFAQTASDARLAQKEFSQSAEILTDLANNPVSKIISPFRRQVEDFQFLVESADLLSRVLSGAADIAENFQNLISSEQSFTSLSPSDKTTALSLLYEQSPELIGIQSNLELAKYKLDQISWKGLLYPFRNKFQGFEARLAEAKNVLDVIAPASQILPSLMGYPEENNFLFILQNKDELRPTGGFIGTYGIVRTRDGEIERFDTHDIYHMDMPVKDVVNVVPPKPLQDYLGVKKWYMRDSNWSPHWPESAEKILDFYKLENTKLAPVDQVNNFSGDFDAVIAINSDVIVNLLKVVGPIEIEGEIYDSDNFTDLLQYKVERGYVQLGIPSWHRKEVIGDIARELKKRLLSRPLSDLNPVIEKIRNSLLKKDMIVYARNPAIQSVLEENNWWGGIREVDSDYLYVVDANMAALKTDAVMTRRIDYKLEQSSSGVFADVTLRYAHGGGFDWRTTRYRTFTRLYVPLGSELISFSGQSEGVVSSDVELNKTVFSAFISVEPGKMGSLNFRYRLPATVARQIINGEYDLLIQRQSGAEVDVSVDLSFNGEINDFKPSNFFVEKVNSNEVIWQNKLNSDTLYSVSFK